MIATKSYAATNSKSPLGPYNFDLRDPRPHDVVIDVRFCGVCHSDIHQARDEWGSSIFPMVPGHEIVGTVKQVGSEVKKFKVGDTVGVGCMVDSCRECGSCRTDLEQYCEKGFVPTYNGLGRDKKTPTYGGYAKHMVVDESFVLSVRSKLPLEQIAPLLCAGITTYSPLKHWKVSAGQKVGVMGLGGLGHMAVKLAAAMGAEVTVLSSSDKKKDDATRLGARAYVNTSNKSEMAALGSKLDLIINTVSAPHNINEFLSLLKRDGTLVLLGVPERGEALQAFSLIGGRRAVAGSLIGGIAETQEMLDFCAAKNIGSDVEVIAIDQINNAYERMIRGDVRYRFVIDLNTLR